MPARYEQHLFAGPRNLDSSSMKAPLVRSKNYVRRAVAVSGSSRAPVRRIRQRRSRRSVTALTAAPGYERRPQRPVSAPARTTGYSVIQRESVGPVGDLESYSTSGPRPARQPHLIAPHRDLRVEWDEPILSEAEHIPTISRHQALRAKSGEQAFQTSRSLRANKIRPFFADHYGGCVCVSSHDFRHDRSVDYAQRLQTIDPQVRIHHCKRIVDAHLATADRVINGIDALTKYVADIVVRLYIRGE